MEKIISKENELIPINQDNNGNVVVSGRELHKFLEIKTPYTQWFDRMKEYGFIENTDFTSLSQKCEKPQGGRPTEDHAIKLDMAKELCMIQRNDKGKQARQYFIAIQKAWDSPEMVMKRAMQFINKKCEALQKQITLDKPKVQFADHVATSNNSMLVRQVAKMISKDGIKIGERKLYTELRKWGWVFKKSCEATQYAIENGYMEISETVKETSKGNFTFNTSRVTGKGQLRIVEKLKAENINLN